MCQPDVEFKDIKLDGWDEVVKEIEDSFNLPEEKVSLDKAAREINAYLQENILKAYGCYYVPCWRCLWLLWLYVRGDSAC